MTAPTNLAALFRAHLAQRPVDVAPVAKPATVRIAPPKPRPVDDAAASAVEADGRVVAERLTPEQLASRDAVIAGVLEGMARHLPEDVTGAAAALLVVAARLTDTVPATPKWGLTEFEAFAVAAWRQPVVFRDMRLALGVPVFHQRTEAQLAFAVEVEALVRRTAAQPGAMIASNLIGPLLQLAAGLWRTSAAANPRTWVVAVHAAWRCQDDWKTDGEA